MTLCQTIQHNIKPNLPTELVSIILQDVISIKEHELFIEKTIESFKFHIHMPYYLSKHHDKPFDRQYDFLKRTFPTVWEKLPESKIRNMIKEIICEVEKSYD